MNLGKNGQMEMIGLVVIVLLITLGLLFLAQFALKETPTKKIFTRKGLAYSSMSALMKTTVNDCFDRRGNSVKNLEFEGDLIEDCVKYGEDVFFGGTTYKCGSERLDSCNYVALTIQELLSSTLGEWGKRYQFESYLLTGADEETRNYLFGNIDEFKPSGIIYSERGGCTGERDTSGLFPIQIEDVGIVENVLYICD